MYILLPAVLCELWITIFYLFIIHQAGNKYTAHLTMWDDELYNKAAAWAVQNKHIHNPDKNVPSGRFKTGESLYWYSTTNHNYKLHPDQAIQSWFDEYANFTYGPLNSSHFDGSRDYHIGHYTQIIWSDSIYVGCATFQNVWGRWKNFFVVCNYGPGGNTLGQTPYPRGGPINKLTCGCNKSDRQCNCNKLYGSRC